MAPVSDMIRGAAPIARRPLHEEVAERLREMITEGLLAPGVRLNERVLCAQLQVSRTPLREALKVLAAERLVELIRIAVRWSRPCRWMTSSTCSKS